MNEQTNVCCSAGASLLPLPFCKSDIYFSFNQRELKGVLSDSIQNICFICIRASVSFLGALDDWSWVFCSVT